MEDEQYEKFIVAYVNDSSNCAVPWTGIDQTLNFVRELLENGRTVQIKPFTRKKWAEYHNEN